MAVAALPPGKKSPIDSMRSNFRGLKNNIKSMSKTVLGIQTALQRANELKRERLETIKENRIKQRDLQQKQAEEERLEKPNVMFSSFSNIKDSIKKSGGGILNSVLKIVGLFAGAWLFNNIDNIKDTIEKAVKVIQDVWTGISNFVSGTFDIVKGLAKTVLAFGKNIIELDFTDKSGRLKEAFSDVELGWKKLSGAITGAEETFDNPEKIEDEKESEDKDTDTDKEEKEGSDETSGNGTSVKVDPLVVLEDNKELIPFGMYDLVKSEVEKNPSDYDTKKEISAALEKYGIDSSEVKYRKNYSSTSNEENLEKKQESMVGKVNQQVNNAEQKLKNEKLTIEGKNNLNLEKITPKAVAETITVIAPPQRSDFANTRSGSRNYSNAMKAYKSGSGDYKLLREKEALEVLN